MDINIGLLSERLERLLAGEEGTFPDAVKQDFENLNFYLGMITSYLRDYQYDRAWMLVEIDRIESPYYKAVGEIINLLAYDSEKIIDKYLIGIMQRENESGSNETSDALIALQNKINVFKLLMLQTQSIPNIIVDLLWKSLETDVDNSPASSGTKKIDTVGRDDKMEEFLDLLIEGPPQLSVVAVLDSIGFDKTAFAAEAYDNNYVKYHFDCHAWVSVSFYHSDHVLDTIMKFVMPSSTLSEIMDKSSEMKKTILHDHLMNKRYLIVLDDVLSNDIWDDVRELLPDNQNGSRILTTVSQTDTLTSFQLENGKNIQLELVPSGRPLRVTYHGWSFLILYHGSMSLQEINIETHTKLVFHLIYKLSLLPFHLKLCSLYMSVFPKHSEISARQLYQLWIAEGFIADNTEATAEDYLEQLISKGLVEAKKRRAGGTIKICSLLHRQWVALSYIAFKWKFIYFPALDGGGKPWENVKWFAANVNKSELNSLNDLDSSLHSLLYLPPKSHDVIACEQICEKFKVLKVLDLGSLVLDQYPSGVEDLFLLKYLKLNIPSLKSLPSPLLRNLLNLYMLDMPSSYIDHISDDIWKMKKLKHLNFGSIALSIHPGEYSNSLENLNFISALHPRSCAPDILGRLSSLRNLRIYGDLNYYQSSLSKSLCRLSSLETLKLVNERNISQLSKIVLIEYDFPPNLTHLSLSNTELMDDPMPTLEKLPNLQVLKLKQNSYAGRKLACGSHGFPKLKVLHLKAMRLEEWAMEIGAMPKLECLVMNPCAYLKRLPQQLWCVKSLKKLELWWPQPELRQKLRVLENKEQYDIQLYPFGK